MDGMTLLEHARAAGLRVWAEGDLLRMRGPRSAKPLVDQLVARKPEILRLLQSAPPPGCPPVGSAVWLLHGHTRQQLWPEPVTVVAVEPGGRWCEIRDSAGHTCWWPAAAMVAASGSEA